MRGCSSRAGCNAGERRQQQCRGEQRFREYGMHGSISKMSLGVRTETDLSNMRVAL
ncbi:hypothetical protein THICB3180054 [Thiomonas sp. CB3]|nr:hypothetical protein THICB3180054 [Thiomonas sp. CB3]